MHAIYWLENLKERDQKEDVGGTWGDNNTRGLWEMVGGVDWMRLAQNRDQWRAVVNTVMNLRVS
jgi:hypothetical protein